LSPLLKQRLDLLAQAPRQDDLRGAMHGIEKESLRINNRGELSQQPHPPAWGSALTHPSITTDYSEALVELITPVSQGIDELFAELDSIHRFAYSELGDELLWTESMPCILPACDNDIPIGWYGTANVGMLKHVYRRGLAVRYGKPMQCIAGIHYNFSLAPALWQAMQQQEGDARSAQDYQSERYVGLIRNFRRYAWLLMYLFGASPAVGASFLRDRVHDLEPFDENTLYLPWATSLRMSDLGYQNNAQASIEPCYNTLEAYLDSLRRAVSTPYPPYEAIGTRRNGEWVQLNTNLLQIENEFYSSIRPKRVARRCERPIQALGARGVQYVEVRCLDIDPFAPMGIEPSTAYFLDSFLLFCALAESPAMSDQECQSSGENFDLVVMRGREPGLQLTRKGQPCGLLEWGEHLLDNMAACADLLDQAHQTSAYSDSLAQQRAKLRDPALTPSARVLAAISEEHEDSFFRFAMAQSEAHREHFLARPLDAAEQQGFVELARQSLADQQALEQADSIDFDTYVEQYLAQ